MSLPHLIPITGQITVWLTDEPVTIWAWQFLQAHLPGQMSFCSHQQLLQSHLTLSENLALLASFYEQVEQADWERLLEKSNLHRAENKSCYYQPRLENRLLSYVMALLPNPDIILLDDLAQGLSPPAQKQVWQFILSEQASHPRTIIYLTSDQEAARVLGDEVWYFEQGQVRQRQAKAAAATSLTTTATIVLEFKDEKSGRDFQQTLQEEPLPEIFSRQMQPDGLTITLQVTDAAATLFELTWRAGRNLVNFSVLPPPKNISSPTRKAPLSSDSARTQIGSTFTPNRPSRAALWQIARSEWLRHFRGFWKVSNLFISAVYSLLILAGVASQIEGNVVGFWRYAPLALVFTAAMIAGFATESIARLAVTGEMETLFAPAKPPSPSRPFSLLAFFDTTPLHRLSLLLGIGIGQLMVWCVHLTLFTIGWVLLLFTMPNTGALVFVSLTFWLLWILDSLAVATVLGCLLTRPRQGFIVGWLSWFLIALSLGRLPLVDIPILWLWPFAGLANAFFHLQDPGRFWLPLLLGMVGSISLWGAAIFMFRYKKSAIGA